jgi:ATP-dependent Zn protease
MNNKSFIIIFLYLILFFFTDNNYFSYISNKEFVNYLSYNSTVFTNNDNLCLLNYTTVFGNSFYYCANFIEPLVEKVNMTTNIFKNIESSNNKTNYLSITNIVIISIIILFYKLSTNIKKISGIEEEIKVNKYKDLKNSKEQEEQTIDNFIGCKNIKRDINELITQIKYHTIFSENECNLPKGVLLLGPPGCGKTHLVKTIINATKINYIFSSGSDFNKIYVGSGTLMLNQIFNKARENKPCLIFIDEADALIKKRTFSDSSAVSAEFGSSLCKLLAELDSIKTEAGIIVIFATNMNEKYIDPALMRAGRIDKILHITEPTFEERKELFKMYLQNLYNENTIDLDTISKLSSGLTGSDIKKIINSLKISKVNEFITEFDKTIQETKEFSDKINISFEKIMKYINFNKNNIKIEHKLEYQINTNEIDREINKCIMGLEREKPINYINKKLIAFHETGHAIMSFLLKDTNLPTKICISITSKTLGYTMYLNDDENVIMNSSLNNLIRQIMILYSGRMAEKLFLNEITCGAEDDYLKARKILKRIILNGMLIPNINLISEKEETENNKIPDFIEKIISNINELLLTQIEILFNQNKLIINDVAELIIINNSITGDDIKNIFNKHNSLDKINSVDIINIIQSIKENITI